MTATVISLRDYYLSKEMEQNIPLKRVEPLSEKNWRLIAAKHYENNQSCGIEEFEQDLKRIKYIKKAITRYKATGFLADRLIMNHIIVLNNVFGPEFTVRLLFFKISEHLSFIKPFLIVLSILPDIVYSVGKNGQNIHTDLIPLNQDVIDILRKTIR